MSFVHAGISGPHPELRAAMAESVNSIGYRDAPEECRISTPVTPEQFEIVCQRTWWSSPSIWEAWDGADISAAIGIFKDGDRYGSWSIQALRRKGEDDWHAASASGGLRDTLEHARQAGGFLHLGGGQAVWAGMIAAALDFHVPGCAAVQVRYDDGTIYEAPVLDDGVLIYAPVVQPPEPEDHFELCYLNADGNVLHRVRMRIGGRIPENLQAADDSD